MRRCCGGMWTCSLGCYGARRGPARGAMFLVMGVIAVVIAEKVGLAILRRAWINLDQVWAAVLINAGVLSLAC